MTKIIGAGMAGLLAGAMFRGNAEVIERSPHLPNNHHALLRFRTDKIARHLNIPFSPVDVIKIVAPFRNKIAESINYSLKSNGRATLRSIHTAEGKVERRFIAPPDFISQLEKQLQRPVRYATEMDKEALLSAGSREPVISTIPMPTLQKILAYPEPSEFGYRHGWVVKGEVQVPSDFCGTIYYPDPGVPMIRATLTGKTIQVEMVENFVHALWGVDRIMDAVLKDFGLEDWSYNAELVRQQYSKITAIPERERRKFIMWATDNFNIFSLGRFAIWKPGLLLDDVFEDVQKVQWMIREGSNYSGRIRA